MYAGTWARSRRHTCARSAPRHGSGVRCHEQRHGGDADEHRPARRHAVAHASLTEQPPREPGNGLRGHDEVYHAVGHAGHERRPDRQQRHEADQHRRRPGGAAHRDATSEKQREPQWARHARRDQHDQPGPARYAASSGSNASRQAAPPQPRRVAVPTAGSAAPASGGVTAPPAIWMDVRSRMPANQSATSAVRRPARAGGGPRAVDRRTARAPVLCGLLRRPPRRWAGRVP